MSIQYKPDPRPGQGPGGSSSFVGVLVTIAIAWGIVATFGWSALGITALILISVIVTIAIIGLIVIAANAFPSFGAAVISIVMWGIIILTFSLVGWIAEKVGWLSLLAGLAGLAALLVIVLADKKVWRCAVRFWMAVIHLFRQPAFLVRIVEPILIAVFIFSLVSGFTALFWGTGIALGLVALALVDIPLASLPRRATVTIRRCVVSLCSGVVTLWRATSGQLRGFVAVIRERHAAVTERPKPLTRQARRTEGFASELVQASGLRFLDRFINYLFTHPVGRFSASFLLSLLIGFLLELIFHELGVNPAVTPAVLGAIAAGVTAGGGGPPPVPSALLLGGVWGWLAGKITGELVTRITNDPLTHWFGEAAGWVLAVYLGWLAGKLVEGMYSRLRAWTENMWGAVAVAIIDTFVVTFLIVVVSFGLESLFARMIG